MISKFLRTILISFSLVFLFSCNSDQNIKEQDKSNVLIDEDFDFNDLRWVEESTKYHNIELSDGKYHIEAKDSIKQTSVAPFNKTYLYDLKESFSITINLDLLNRDTSILSRAGIMFTCASVDYRVFISNKSEVIVTEEILVENRELIILSKPLNGDLSKTVQDITVDVNGYNADLQVNGKAMGEFKMKSKAIEGVRIFTSAQTSIDVYKFRIENN